MIQFWTPRVGSFGQTTFIETVLLLLWKQWNIPWGEGASHSAEHPRILTYKRQNFCNHWRKEASDFLCKAFHWFTGCWHGGEQVKHYPNLSCRGQLSVCGMCGDPELSLRKSLSFNRREKSTSQLSVRQRKQRGRSLAAPCVLSASFRNSFSFLYFLWNGGLVFTLSRSLHPSTHTCAQMHDICRQLHASSHLEGAWMGECAGGKIFLLMAGLPFHHHHLETKQCNDKVFLGWSEQDAL